MSAPTQCSCTRQAEITYNEWIHRLPCGPGCTVAENHAASGCKDRHLQPGGEAVTSAEERAAWLTEGAPIAARAESAIAVLHKRVARLIAHVDALERERDALREWLRAERTMHHSSFMLRSEAQQAPCPAASMERDLAAKEPSV